MKTFILSESKTPEQFYPTITSEEFNKLTRKKLVGSQFFGTNRDDSDYDFLIDIKDKEMYELLMLYYELGKVTPHVAYKLNNLTQSTYCCKLEDGTKIHFITTNFFDLLINAFEVAKALHLFNKMGNKQDAMFYFNAYCNWQWYLSINNFNDVIELQF